MVNIDERQFGFVPGRYTTDAIFIVCQVQEKGITAKNIHYVTFFDLAKAFNRVPRKVLWRALRSLGVEELAVRVIKGMHSNAPRRFLVNGEYSEAFGVGVHQGSVLIPLLFILLLEALSCEVRAGIPWELFCTDDLVLIVDTQEVCISKIKAWKAGK